MIDVLRRGRPDRQVTTNCQNQECGSRLRVRRSEGQFRTDRDGDAYVFRCPVCRSEIWIDASVMDRGRA